MDRRSRSGGLSQGSEGITIGSEDAANPDRTPSREAASGSSSSTPLRVVWGVVGEESWFLRSRDLAGVYLRRWGLRVGVPDGRPVLTSELGGSATNGRRRAGNGFNSGWWPSGRRFLGRGTRRGSARGERDGPARCPCRSGMDVAGPTSTCSANASCRRVGANARVTFDQRFERIQISRVPTRTMLASSADYCRSLSPDGGMRRGDVISSGSGNRLPVNHESAIGSSFEESALR